MDSTHLTEASNTLSTLSSYINQFHDQQVILNNDLLRTREQIQEHIQLKESYKNEVERLTLAAKALQSVIDNTSAKNLKRVVDVVNIALSTVFINQGIEFKIDSSIKRNVPTYELKLVQNGIEGSLNSFGGGVLSVVSVVLKIMLNVMSKSSPLICLDETLSGLSVEYIPAVSRMLKEICSKFGIYLVLVTHQSKFLDYCDTATRLRTLRDNHL